MIQTLVKTESGFTRIRSSSGLDSVSAKGKAAGKEGNKGAKKWREAAKNLAESIIMQSI